MGGFGWFALLAMLGSAGLADTMAGAALAAQSADMAVIDSTSGAALQQQCMTH